MTDFTGKIALVTGAGSGIGRAAARLYAARGGTVIAFDKTDAVHDTAHGHDRITAMTGDAGDQGDVDRAVAAAVATGGLDFAFANAGVGGGLSPLFEVTAAEWEAVLRVNLIGVFLLVQAAARVMVAAKRGSIVATASVAGIRSGAGGIPYSASKAGVINLVAVTANQLAGSGVRVNAVCPGLTETGMTAPFFDYARSRGTEGKLGQLNPLKRAAQPAEVAEVALFLASDAASLRQRPGDRRRRRPVELAPRRAGTDGVAPGLHAARRSPAAVSPGNSAGHGASLNCRVSQSHSTRALNPATPPRWRNRSMSYAGDPGASAASAVDSAGLTRHRVVAALGPGSPRRTNSVKTPVAAARHAMRRDAVRSNSGAGSHGSTTAAPTAEHATTSPAARSIVRASGVWTMTMPSGSPPSATTPRPYRRP